jgi:hypothetical protein
LRSGKGPHHHSQTLGRRRPPFSSSVSFPWADDFNADFARLASRPTTFPAGRTAERDFYPSHGLVPWTSAARCNSATRAWMSSRWMASGPQVRVASAAQTRVDAGLFGSTMTLPMVAAARDICCNREIDCRRQPRRASPEASGTLARRAGWGLGPERLQHVNQAGLLR